ncbi:MAG: hypothetical protein Q9204_005926 [Flavoplaca sp. TL-2023a]
MVHTGRDLVPTLLAFYTAILYGLCEIKEYRKQKKADERTKSERQELEAELATSRDQLNAAKAHIKSLEADATKWRAAESEAKWRQNAWRWLLPAGTNGDVNLFLRGNPVSVIVLFFWDWPPRAGQFRPPVLLPRGGTPAAKG